MRSPALLLVTLALTAGCASSAPPLASTGAGPVAPAATPAVATAVPAEWRPTDRWTWEWSAGADKGTKSAEVIERKTIGDAAFYLVRIGEFVHYYTSALDWAGAAKDGVVQARVEPPQPWFQWPLDVGRRWAHDGHFQGPEGSRQQQSRYAVTAVETIDVPAGRFKTIKIVRETSERDYDEYWYAPDVGWYVRWVGRRGELEFEERLTEHHRARRLIPTAATPAR